MAALGTGDDGRPAQLLHQAVIRLSGKVMGDVEAAELGDIVIAQGHRVSFFV